MNNLKKASLILLASLFACLAQVPNVQFKDMSGKSYDLYQLLAAKRYVYVEMIFNT